MRKIGRLMLLQALYSLRSERPLKRQLEFALPSAAPQGAAPTSLCGIRHLFQKQQSLIGGGSVMNEREFAKAFAGRWRIVKMDMWNADYLDLFEPAFIQLGATDGAFLFGAVKGWLDIRYGIRDGSACAEFSWEGFNDSEQACGRGRVILGTAGRLIGDLFIHNSDNSAFTAERR